MKDLLLKRRQQFLARCLKYLRYVLNDHFVVVLLFLLGFLLVEYRQLLLDFPKNPWLLVVILFIGLGMLLFSGRIATYLLPADKQFLLVKEEELLIALTSATRRSFYVHAFIFVLVFFMMIPLLLAMGLSFWVIGLMLLALLGLKYAIILRKARAFYRSSGLDFDRVIQLEKKRQQAILGFFALFTTVKGFSTSTRRRAYLDGVLSLFPHKTGRVWEQLYLRAFLRSGDYLGLTVRLSLLSLISLIAIRPKFVAVALTLLFNYLLLFQLLTLYKHYDYQSMTQLFPIGVDGRRQQLQGFLRRLFSVLAVCEAILVFSLPEAAVLVGVMVSLVEWYLPYKLKKLSD